MSMSATVGIRLDNATPDDDGRRRCTDPSAEGGGSPLVYANAEDVALAVGDRVVVAGRNEERCGVVVVAARQVLECPPLGVLPRVRRHASAPRQCPPTTGAGATLLATLGLPPAEGEPRDSASGRPSAGDEGPEE